MVKEIICTVCPRGCSIQVDGDGKNALNIQGYGCRRGQVYAGNEYSNPVRILTTNVKIQGRENELLPVRSNKPLPKEKLLVCMEEIKKAVATLPVKTYDVIIEDICGTGVNIVATKEIK